LPPKIAKAPVHAAGAFKSYRTCTVGSVLIVIAAVIISLIGAITIAVTIVLVAFVLIGVTLLAGIITAPKFVPPLHVIAGRGAFLLVEEFIYLGPAFGVDLDQVERIRCA
jgi:hypothetical protein